MGCIGGLIVGSAIGATLGVAGFLAFHVYLMLTVESPSPDSLGPLFSVYVGTIMGLFIGSPTGLIVGVVVGIYFGTVSAGVKPVTVGVFVGILVCGLAMAGVSFFPPLAYGSVIVGGAFVVGAGAIAGIATGALVRRKERDPY